jgi:hypothetical protein
MSGPWGNPLIEEAAAILRRGAGTSWARAAEGGVLLVSVVEIQGELCLCVGLEGHGFLCWDYSRNVPAVRLSGVGFRPDVAVKVASLLAALTEAINWPDLRKQHIENLPPRYLPEDGK